MMWLLNKLTCVLSLSFTLFYKVKTKIFYLIFCHIWTAIILHKPLGPFHIDTILKEKKNWLWTVLSILLLAGFGLIIAVAAAAAAAATAATVAVVVVAFWIYHKLSWLG